MVGKKENQPVHFNLICVAKKVFLRFSYLRLIFSFVKSV